MLLVVAALLDQSARLVHAAADHLTEVSTDLIRPEANDQLFSPARRLGYRYSPRYLPLPGLPGRPRMHYLDEGDPQAGRVLLLLHGGPFWSFCWVRLVKKFTRKGFRVVAPDLVGKGGRLPFVALCLCAVFTFLLFSRLFQFFCFHHFVLF